MSLLQIAHLSIAGLLALVCATPWIGAKPARAADFPPYDLRSDPVAVADQIPDDLKSGRYTLWLPDDHEGKKIRAIIVVVDYEDGKALWADTPNTQIRAQLNQIMNEHSLGMMLEYTINRDDKRKLYKNPDNDWAARSAFHALRHFAGVTKHPELTHVPVIWTGLSQSGGTAYLRSALAPERTIGAIAYHAAVGNDDLSKAYGVPILAPLGALDSLTGRSTALYPTALSKGALWLPYLQANTPHHRLHRHNNFEVECAWLQWVIRYRLPAEPPGDGPVTLKPLMPEAGYYIQATFGGDGRDSPFKFKTVHLGHASAGIPKDAVGWLPESLLDVWKKHNQTASESEITVTRSP